MAERRPVIGINCADGEGENELRGKLHLLRVYVQAVEQAGGIPVLFPQVEADETIQSLVDMVDGLVLSGGGGLPPEIAALDRLPSLSEQHPLRHRFDCSLIEKALEKDIPMLGICRGHQTINEVAGGTTLLHLGDCTKHNHLQTERDDQVTHDVIITAGSRLGRLLDYSQVGVNSFHRQAIGEAAPSFTVTAIAEDGIIEAIESKEHSFVMGCQFHPESLLYRDERFANIYRGLVEAARLKL